MGRVRERRAEQRRVLYESIVNDIGDGIACERAAGVAEGGSSVPRARARGGSWAEREVGGHPGSRTVKDEGAACVGPGRTGCGREPVG